MTVLLVILVTVVVTSVVVTSVVVYRRLPLLSTEWRIKLVPYEASYGDKSGGMRIDLVKRFCSGNFSSDRIEFQKVPYDSDDFDNRLADALIEARAYRETLVTHNRILKRLDR